MMVGTPFHAVYEQVVHDSTLSVGQAAVLHLSHGELRCIVAGDLLDEVQGTGTAHDELSHVAHIEHAHTVAHGMVLVIDAGVLYGHHIAGEGHHLGAEGFMDVRERGSLQV